MSHIPNYVPGANIREEYRCWFRLRDAIFLQAFMDWKNTPKKHREYILNTFAKLPHEKQVEQLQVANMLHLRWSVAADVYMWFQSEESDYWLIDTDLTGRDIWRMFLDGSYNRGRIRDKKYHRLRFPTDAECKKPLPERFNDKTDFTFADRAFPERKARERRKKSERSKK